MKNAKTSIYNFFKGCTTLDEVKQLYKTLAKQHHPDLNGGDTAKMQALNNDYEIAVKLTANQQREAGKMSNEEFEQTIADTEAYKNAINAIISVEGLIIEVVGSWVWVTGNTYPHRDALKSGGFLFASKKKAWYFRTEEFKVKNTNKNYSLEDIKSKYGSVQISGGRSFSNLLAC